MTSWYDVTVRMKLSLVKPDAAAPMPSILRRNPPYMFKRGNLVFLEEEVGRAVDNRETEPWMIVGYLYVCPLFRNNQIPTLEVVAQWRVDNPNAPVNWLAAGAEIPQCVFASFAVCETNPTTGEKMVACTVEEKPVVLLFTVNMSFGSRVFSPKVFKDGDQQFAGLAIMNWDIVNFDYGDSQSLRRTFNEIVGNLKSYYELEDML